MYNLDWFENFEGEIDFKIFNLNFFIQGLEKYVSQYEYTYLTNIDGYKKIKIKFTNEQIPHLIGLSKYHHKGLSEYKSSIVFDEIKNNVSLKDLIDKDSQWFKVGREKIVGLCYMYELLNLISTNTFSTIRLLNKSNATNIGNNKFTRDRIYFLIVTDSTRGVEYSLELTKGNSEELLFYPKSIKCKPKNKVGSEPVCFKLESKYRIKSTKKKNTNIRGRYIIRK